MEAIEALLEEAEAQIVDLPDTDRAELIQYYQNLGYLPMVLVPMVSDPQLTEASRTFKRDLRSSGLFSPTQLSKLRRVHRELYLLEVLRLLMDLDEGRLLPHLPATAATTLPSRLAHYRLSVYGLYPSESITAPFGKADSMGLKMLRSFTGLIDNLEALNLLADKESLTQRLLFQWGFDEGFVIFQALDPPPSIDTKALSMNLAFIEHAKKDLKRSPQDTEALKKAILRVNQQNIDWSYIHQRASAPINQFFIRLVQVHQWTSGLYDGKLDGTMGPVTLDAIQNLVQVYNQADPKDKDIHLKKLLAYLGDGYFVFNATYFLKEYMQEQGAAPGSETDVIRELTRNTQALSPQAQQTFTENTQKLFGEARNRIVQEAQPGLGQPVQRIYQGMKSFFANLFRWGKNLVNAIVSKAKAVWETLTKMFERILRGARRALQAFVRGIKLVLGRLPIVTQQANSISMTRLELGGDGLAWIDNRWNADQIHQHRKDVLKFQNGIQFSTAVLGELLQLTKALVVGVVAWPLLLLQIVNSFKTVIKKYQTIYS